LLRFSWIQLVPVSVAEPPWAPAWVSVWSRVKVATGCWVNAGAPPAMLDSAAGSAARYRPSASSWAFVPRIWRVKLVRVTSMIPP
jgi:hypothetical protein